GGVVDGQPRLARALAERVHHAEASADPDRPRGSAHPRRLRVLGPPLRVLVPAAPGLAAEPAGGDHLRAERRGSPARLAEALLVERLRDGEADVDAAEVLQLERPHAKAAAESHDAIDRLDLGHALLQEVEGLDAERPVRAVDEEPRAV